MHDEPEPLTFKLPLSLSKRWSALAAFPPMTLYGQKPEPGGTDATGRRVTEITESSTGRSDTIHGRTALLEFCNLALGHWVREFGADFCP